MLIKVRFKRQRVQWKLRFFLQKCMIRKKILVGFCRYCTDIFSWNYDCFLPSALVLSTICRYLYNCAQCSEWHKSSSGEYFKSFTNETFLKTKKNRKSVLFCNIWVNTVSSCPLLALTHSCCLLLIPIN